MSTKSIFASQYKTQFELATKVFGDVQAISPVFKSRALHAI